MREDGGLVGGGVYALESDSMEDISDSSSESSLSGSSDFVTDSLSSDVSESVASRQAKVYVLSYRSQRVVAVLEEFSFDDEYLSHHH